MNGRASFSDAEWEAWARGEKLAEAKRPLRLPTGMTFPEQTAFREAYYVKREDIQNRSVVAAIKRMLGGASVETVIRHWVKR